MTRAPSFPASSTVRSLDPLSTTITSSAHRKLSMARGRLRSSLYVMIVAEIFTGFLEAVGADRREREAHDKNDQRRQSQPAALGTQAVRIHDRRMPQRHEEQHDR